LLEAPGDGLGRGGGLGLGLSSEQDGRGEDRETESAEGSREGHRSGGKDGKGGRRSYGPKAVPMRGGVTQRPKTTRGRAEARPRTEISSESGAGLRGLRLDGLVL